MGVGREPVVAAGINKSHGASLCLVDGGGEPVFCASEERFTRLKLQRGMPHRTYEYASQYYAVDDATLAIARLGTTRRIAREAQAYGRALRAGRFRHPSNRARIRGGGFVVPQESAPRTRSSPPVD